MSHPKVRHPKEILEKKIRDKSAFSRFNDRFAIWIGTHVGSMYCFYLFNVIAFLSLKSALETHNLVPIINWVSSNWIQLILLPAIMVAQNIAQAAQEAKTETDHETLTYLATLQDEQMKILYELKKLRKE